MKTTVNKYNFRDAFNAVRPDNFSYEGQGALYDHFEREEEECGIEVELDVIAFCCEFSEGTLGEFKEQYDLDTFRELEENTTVIYVSEPDDFEDPDDDTVVIIADY